MESNPEYGSYLAEIKTRLLRVLIIFAIGFSVGLLFNSQIISFILNFFKSAGVNIAITSPGQIVELPIYCGLAMGLLMAIPFLSFQLLAFVKPALSDKERKFINSLIPINVVLFTIGVVVGILMVQIVIKISSSYSSVFQISNIWDIRKFFILIFSIAIISGLVFQLPIILTFLLRSGLVKRKWFITKRKYFYLGLIIFVVLLPPTDIISTLILTIPLILLSEIALILNRKYE